MSSRFASIFSAASVALLLALAGCGNDDLGLPKAFGGSEVPTEVLNEPRVVPVPPPPPEQRTWLLLGAVPSHPKDFTPQPTINAAKGQMESDRDDATRMQQNYQNSPPVTPEGAQFQQPQPDPSCNRGLRC